MSLWGNNDNKTVSGTIEVFANGLVTGSTTDFDVELDPGDYITVANVDHRIVSITNATSMQVVAGILGGTVAAIGSGATFTASEKPIYTSAASVGENSNLVFGVNTTEAGVGNGTVIAATITFAGSGYTANATVTVSGGLGATTPATANAFVNTSIGDVTEIKFSNNGIGYLTAPTLTVAAPSAITFNALTAVSNTNDTIALTSANSKFQVGDYVKYLVAASNTAVVGLANNTSYYVVFANTTQIALSDTKGGANIDLTATVSETGHSLTGETATAVAILSSGKPVAHSGWVKRTVGTGGRAGRVQYETLVATGSIANDAEDVVFKDA